MAEPRARTLPFTVTLDEAWTATSDRGGAALEDDPETWTPEHLLLAGLARCSLTSLRHHARRAGSELAATARAHGTVTRRERDGRFAFVELTVEIGASLEPPLAGEELAAVLAKAERDCFVGASLAVAPAYRFTIDGEEIA
jgi:organic hydroperoxide reductase OsmC/OhrA